MLNGLKAKDVIAKLTYMATEAYDKKNYLYYYLYTRQTYFIYREPEILYNFILACYYLKDYEKVITFSIEWLQSSHKATAQQIAEVYYLKAKSYYEMKMFVSAYDNFKIALSEFIKLKNNQRLSEIDKILRDQMEVRRAPKAIKTYTQKKDECQRGMEFLNQQQPLTLGSVVYIMPLDWLKRWKEYVGYTSESDKEMELESDKNTWLGPIMQDSLLEEDFYLIDPSEEEYPCNVQIRTTAIEGENFIFVSEETWNFFYEKYGGIPIPRFTYQSPYASSPKIEIWLQKLSILLFPLPKKDQPKDLGIKDIVYVKNTITVGELIKKLIRIYGKVFPNASVSLYDRRLWRTERNFSINEVWKVWKGKGPVEISGTLLEEEMQISALEIDECDTMILECRILKDFWFIESDDVATKLFKRRLTREKSLKTLELADYPEGSCKGVAGLQNLGNTCFMNSAIQCLSNCYPLTSFFLTDDYERDINMTNPLGTGGKLVLSYADLIKDLWLGQESRLAPHDLKRVISKHQAQFSGYGQQDSQEFLSYLLDGLHEDLNRVSKTEIKEKSSQERSSDLVSAEVAWKDHLKLNQSRIQELFHGQFKSTIKCPDCGSESRNFESFMMLSLPIPNEQFVKMEVYFILNNAVPLKIDLNIMGNTTVRDLKVKIATLGKTNPDHIVLGLVKTFQLQTFVRDEIEAFQLASAPETIYCYELPDINPNYHTLDETIFLAKVFIIGLPKDIYKPEEHKSYTRVICYEPLDTFRLIKLRVYRKMRRYLKNYYQIQNMSHKFNLDDNSSQNIEKEFNYYFAAEQEGIWPYNLYIHINYINKTMSIENIEESTTIQEFLKENRYTPNQLSFKLKIARHVKYEQLNLNQCTSVSAGDDKSLDKNRSYNLDDCFALFTREEKLSYDNAWMCTKCNKQKQATKKLEFYRSPDILIIHLKRFKNIKLGSIGVGGFSKKLTSFVEFPVQGFDIKNYVLSNSSSQSTVYDLFGVTNHFGELGGGHYTALGKNALDNNWYEYNDSVVKITSEKDIVNNSAYILFYQRRKEI